MGRTLAKRKGPQIHGQFVSDYITAAQRGLNRGPQGWLAGKLIQRGRRNTEPSSLNRFMADHYARFRAGPREALRHWGYEVGESMHQSAKRKGMSDEQSARRMSGFLRGQRKAQAGVDQQLWHHGRNEAEAIAHVGNHPDKDIQGNFRRLAAHKADAVKTHYGPMALTAPGALAAGAGLYASGAAARKRERQFSALPLDMLGALSLSKRRVPRPALIQLDVTAPEAR